MTDNDLELLARYARTHNEDAFGEIVRRHLDLVYSAAFRAVRSRELAEEAAQSAFTDLARAADKLAPDTILAAWLYQVARRKAIDIVRREARRPLREQIATETHVMNASPDWPQIEPLLDEAMDTLDQAERAAILLRYFENKSLHEVGHALGTSEDAAQKRVGRAVEHLREYFRRRGAGIAATALIALLTANAVHSAPVGLSITITSAAAATATVASVGATAVKTVAMTTLQKTLVATALLTAAGVGIYEAGQNSTLQRKINGLQQQQAPLTDQVQQLQQERDEISNRLAALQTENQQLKSAQKSADVLKLRGEVGKLRQQNAANEAQLKISPKGLNAMMSDPAMKEYIHQTQMNLAKTRYAPLFQELKLTPEQCDEFVGAMSDSWLRHTEQVSQMKPGSGFAEADSGASAKDDLKDRLHAVLGDAGYARYKEFEQEVPARAALKLLDTQLGDTHLSDAQVSGFIQLVRAEPYEAMHGLAGDMDKAFLGSSEDVDKHLLKVEQSNQHLLQQAAVILEPDQLNA